jgi:phospholipid/cholesterol/gamma-HCH transport system substrate-binding protein
MPSAKKVSWAQLRVGIMAIVALILLSVLVFLLTGSKSLFSKKDTIYTFLDDSAALTVGSAVRLNGVVVGRVTKVALSGETMPNRIVRLDLEVDDKFLPFIPEDSRASISAENVLGTKFINIKKGRSGTAIKPGGTVASLDTREFDEVVQSGYALLTSAQEMLKRIDGIVSIVEAGKGSIGRLLVDEEFYNRANAILAETQKLTTALGSNQGTVGRLIYDDQLYRDMRGTLSRVDSLLAELQDGKGSAGKLLKDPALYDDTRKSVNEVRTLLADVNAGKGTVGKLLKSEDMHKQISGTISKLDSMLDRMNSGQGTIGQLLVNPQLYDNLNGASKEMNGLMKDFRANPKKFLQIQLKLF